MNIVSQCLERKFELPEIEDMQELESSGQETAELIKYPRKHKFQEKNQVI